MGMRCKEILTIRLGKSKDLEDRSHLGRNKPVDELEIQLGQKEKVQENTTQ